jgi:hypothetical protein
MGQLLEYNYYGDRQPADRWLIILDQGPSARDKQYISKLRTVLKLPLALGWEAQGGFEFDLPLR